MAQGRRGDQTARPPCICHRQSEPPRDLAIARLDRSRECVYNVCSGRALPVRRLLDWILEEAGVDPEVRVDPARVRPGEPVRIVGSPERLRQRAGWRVERDVRDAVREVYRRTGRTPAP